MASRASGSGTPRSAPGAGAYTSSAEQPLAGSEANPLSQPEGADGDDRLATNTIENPYANHPQLSSTEAALLYEYHKLASTLKRIQEISYPLASPSTHTALLQSMRVLERKMGLVLTLFKASVWALLVERQDAAEAEAAAAAAAQHATAAAGSAHPHPGAPGSAPSYAMVR